MKNTKVTESIYEINTCGFSQNFYLDFLGLYDIYFENSFIYKPTKMGIK